MNKDEARGVLAAHLEQYRRRTYGDLSRTLGNQGCDEVIGPSGAEYQVEVDILWDNKPGGLLRILGSIDDGRLPGAMFPLTAGFLLRPDGTLVE
jgi:hypothetical protein